MMSAGFHADAVAVSGTAMPTSRIAASNVARIASTLAGNPALLKDMGSP